MIHNDHRLQKCQPYIAYVLVYYFLHLFEYNLNYLNSGAYNS